LKKKCIQLFNDFAGLFYPEICVGCGRKLYQDEKGLCLYCLAQLPRTNFHEIRDNAIERRFYGKVKIQYASSFLYFEKELLTQKLLHEIKYRGGREMGRKLGTYFGRELMNSCFNEVDIIIPVPLHKNKQRARGFNQSEFIAEGIGKSMNKPVLFSVLEREIENPTQTNKNVYERWENVVGIFKLKEAASISGQHVLLVDDVLTTGSTLEACILPLLQVDGVKVSVAALAAAI
jgi:ComF family protein